MSTVAPAAPLLPRPPADCCPPPAAAAAIAAVLLRSCSSRPRASASSWPCRASSTASSACRNASSCSEPRPKSGNAGAAAAAALSAAGTMLLAAVSGLREVCLNRACARMLHKEAQAAGSLSASRPARLQTGCPSRQTTPRARCLSLLGGAAWPAGITACTGAGGARTRARLPTRSAACRRCLRSQNARFTQQQRKAVLPSSPRILHMRARNKYSQAPKTTPRTIIQQRIREPHQLPCILRNPWCKNAAKNGAVTRTHVHHPAPQHKGLHAWPRLARAKPWPPVCINHQPQQRKCIA